ncbi:hypothetical protein ACIBG7_33595 [Nonomuraea sp. NPDC050328]|uniref:hypothetical protein n=1 Tax=Nonomuraea sp. NPDC050328 TaxID=3364361 RepID=UPI00379611FA
MTRLERRYRAMLRFYPADYRDAHGDELLDVLLETAEPGRTLPAARECAGLVVGGVQARVRANTRTNPWWDGLHLGLTAIMVAQAAAFLPYTGSVPIWTALSLAALLAVLRGHHLIALPLVALTGVKAFTISDGQQFFELTLLPVYPDLLTDQPLFRSTTPFAVSATYVLVAVGLIALASRRAGHVRSGWWLALAPALAWMGPEWMDRDLGYPLSLSRLILEAALLGAGVWAGYLARDPRWALGGALYLVAVSTEMAQHLSDLTGQHLGYWGLLGFMTFAAAAVPYRQRRHALD